MDTEDFPDTRTLAGAAALWGQEKATAAKAAPMGYDWFLGSGWQERSRKLYSLAGEVARKLAAK